MQWEAEDQSVNFTASICSFCRSGAGDGDAAAALSIISRHPDLQYICGVLQLVKIQKNE